ncbi:hypothetical protein WJX79_005755 [Trebouxia sp. C0005]
MKIFVELDGSPAKLLSVSENVNVGEIRDALKASALEWSFDDGTFVKAADARQLSHLVADGLATSGRSASDAIKVQTIKQGSESCQNGLVQPTQAASGLPHGSKGRALANTPTQPRPSSATPSAPTFSRATTHDLSASSCTVIQGQSQQTAAAASAHSRTADGSAALTEPSKLVSLRWAALDQPKAATTPAIEGSHQTDEQTQSHHHPRCYSEKFGARCIVCNKVDTDITLEGRPMHRLCFKCSGCHKVIDGKYTSDDAKQAHYHPNCYKEKFGARCSACNKLFSGKYTVVGGKSLHYECFLCTDCHLPIGDGKYQTHGHDKQPYHQTCHRKNFDPRCDVCSELVPQLADGHLEYCVSSFWKQNTSEAQPLYDNVLGFFAKMGLALRERPPMMLVDGDTLDQERKPCREADKQAPIFHTLGLCLKRGHGHVKHVVHSQPGLSSVYRQPSLNATLRPADLSQVEWEVKGILVMYGLPSLLTGAILAHEVMHAWVAENNINCGHAEGDKLSAVGEGIAELLGFMWLEAQASPVAAAPTQGSVNVPLPKSKAVDNRTWAQRVSADGRKYFLDPVTRQTTWHDPNRWQEVVAPDGFKVYLDQSATSGFSSAAKILAAPSVPVAALQNLMPEWREHVNTEGKKFYHNSRTRESLWVLPDDVKQQVLWFEKLSSYYGNQTRTNTDKVYGEGFRAAYEAFQQYGLRNVLLHVKKNNFLPRVDDVVDSSGSKNSIKSALHSAK